MPRSLVREHCARVQPSCQLPPLPVCAFARGPKCFAMEVKRAWRDSFGAQPIAKHDRCPSQVRLLFLIQAIVRRDLEFGHKLACFGCNWSSGARITPPLSRRLDLIYRDRGNLTSAQLPSEVIQLLGDPVASTKD